MIVTQSPEVGQSYPSPLYRVDGKRQKKIIHTLCDTIRFQANMFLFYPQAHVLTILSYRICLSRLHSMRDGKYREIS